MKLRAYTAIAAVCLATAVAFCSTPARADRGDIAVGGEFVMRIRTGAAGLTLDQRVNTVTERLVPILSMPNLSAASVHEVFHPKSVEIWVGNHLLITTTPADAKANGLKLDQQATLWVDGLKKALPELNAKPNANNGAPTTK